MMLQEDKMLASYVVSIAIMYARDA